MKETRMRTYHFLILAIGLGAFGCTKDSGTALQGGNPVNDLGADDGGVSSVDGGTIGGDMATSTDAMALDSTMMSAADMGAVEEPTCESTCNRFVECAEVVCPMGNGIVLRAACRMACQDSDDFVELAGDGQVCADLVTFVGRRSDAVAERCGEGTIPSNPICEAYARTASACMLEACPNAEQIGPGNEALFRSICSDAIARGDFQRAQLEGVEDAMCGHPLVGPVIAYLTTASANEGSGGLEPLCTEGPLVAGEVCHTACERLGECIPEGTSEEMGGYLRDYPSCRYVCGVTEGITDATWSCLSTANECAEAFQCFDTEPAEVEECRPYSELVARCLVGECAQAMPVQAGVGKYAYGICNALVDNSTFTVEALAEATAQDQCGMMTEPIVRYLLDSAAPGEGSGALEGLCADMPANPLPMCQAACTQLGPCIPDDADGRELRDRDFCEIFCVTNTDAISSDAWSCLSEATMCADVGPCFVDE